jgi:hypothetical protein
MITKPAAEWDVVAAEPASVAGLYTGYACILAAIPAIAGLIGSVLFVHLSPIAAVAAALLQYVFALVGVFISAFIIDALAPSFGGEKNQVQALKLVVYANTALWVAGIANIIPFVGGLVVLVGLVYTLYTLYLGLPKLMKSPADKTTGYFIVSIIVEIVVYFVMIMIAGAIATMVFVGALATGAAATGAIH